MKIKFRLSESSKYVSLLERTYTVGSDQYWKRGGKYFTWSEAGGRREITQEEYFKALSGGKDEAPQVKRELPKIDKKDYKDASDEDLALLASSGDERATDIIIRRYEPLVHKLSNKYFLKGGDKDDLVQAGLVGMWDGIKSWDGVNDNFGKYIGGFIDKRLKSAVRNDDTQKNYFNTSAASLDGNAPGKDGDEAGSSYHDTVGSKELSVEDQVLGKDGADKLMNFMKTELAPKERDAIFRFINGAKIPEIAEEMGISYKSVENAIGRVRYKIKSFMEQNPQNESKSFRFSTPIETKLIKGILEKLSDENLKEASFIYNGKEYKHNFGHYYCDGEMIGADDYRLARNGYDSEMEKVKAKDTKDLEKHVNTVLGNDGEGAYWISNPKLRSTTFETAKKKGAEDLVGYIVTDHSGTKYSTNNSIITNNPRNVQVFKNKVDAQNSLNYRKSDFFNKVHRVSISDKGIKFLKD